MTTLVPALTNALSGLVTSKSAIDVLSNNIANVNTEGYTRKLVRAESVTLGGQGVGTRLATVTRQVDLKLQKDILTETGILSNLDTSANYYSQIQDLFGNTADNNSIAHLISDFSQRLQTLANSPTAVAAQYEAAQEAQSLSGRFNTMSEQLQYLRVEADRAVEDAVARVNEQLTLVKNLNDYVLREKALGKTTADLEDQRDVALKDLAQLIDIRINPQSDGTTMVFTTSGRPLVDVGGARLLTHSSVNSLSADMTKAGGNIAGITSLGRDLTSVIQGGELKALIDMRDTTLPNLQSELDMVAKQLMDDMNQIHNRGVSFPTLQQNLNGSRAFIDSANQTITYGSGDTVVGLFNSDGSASATTTIKTIRGGEGPHTVDNVAAGLQNWLRTTGGLTTATVAVDSTTGQLDIALNSTNVGLAFRDQPMTEFTSAAYKTATTQVDSTGALAAGTMTFTDTLGNAVTVNLDNLVPSTLTTIASDINTLGGGNFTASVVKDDGGYRLEVKSLAGGGKDMTISNTGPAGWMTALNLTPTADQADATINFDGDADGFSVANGDQAVQGFSNFFGLNDLFVDDHDSAIYDTPVRASTWTTNGVAALNILDSTTGTAAPVSVAISAGWSLERIATAINDDVNASALVTASVVPDGSGYRLRLTHVDNTEMTLTGSAVSALGLTTTASGTGLRMDVRSDIKLDASLMSRGAMVVNSDSTAMRYQLSEGDNTTIRAMVDKMSNTVQFSAAGNIATGKYTYSDYGAAIISVNARGAEVNKNNLEYQAPLNESLEARQKNLSGVNLDEELASLIILHTAYQAAARVVSVTQKMMDILDGIIS